MSDGIIIMGVAAKYAQRISGRQPTGEELRRIRECGVRGKYKVALAIEEIMGIHRLPGEPLKLFSCEAREAVEVRPNP